MNHRFLNRHSLVILLCFLFQITSLMNMPMAEPPASRSKLNPSVINQQMREFIKQQKKEINKILDQRKIQLKELKASQAKQMSEWEASEVIKRRQFFRMHPKGADKRDFILDRDLRRIALKNSFISERKHIENDYEVRIKSLKEDQASKLEEFKTLLAQGELPPLRLWPVGY